MIVEMNYDLLQRSGTSVNAVESFWRDMNYCSFHVKDSADAIAIPREKMSLLRENDDLWLERS